jgi:hypothetical protein
MTKSEESFIVCDISLDVADQIRLLVKTNRPAKVMATLWKSLHSTCECLSLYTLPYFLSWGIGADPVRSGTWDSKLTGADLMNFTTLDSPR